MAEGKKLDWHVDSNVFFAQSAEALSRYRVSGPYEIKMEFWRLRVDSDDRQYLIWKGWSIVEAFIGMPQWDVSHFAYLLQVVGETGLLTRKRLDAAIAADLVDRLRDGFLPESELSGIAIRFGLFHGLQLHKAMQLVDLEATELVNHLQEQAKNLRGAPLPRPLS